MLYQHSFMQADWVPVEHLEMDKKRRKESCVEEIMRMVLRDFPFESQVQPNGNIVYRVALAVISAEKYNRALGSVERLLCHHPDLQSAVLQVLQEMDEPENNIDQP